MTTLLGDGTNFAELESRLCKWINDVTPSTVTVYQANTSAPLPYAQAFTMLLTNIRNVGYDYTYNDPNDTEGVDFKNFGTYELTFAFTVYSGSIVTCMQVLQIVRNALQTVLYSDLSEGYFFGKVAFMRFDGNAVDISSLQANTDPYFTRALTQNIIFSAVNEYKNAISSFNEVSGTANIASPTGQVVFNEDFTVTTD
jgi:hypothetical protein